MPPSFTDLLSKAEQQTLLDQSTQLELRKGELLFEIVSEANHFYLVKRGKISLYRLMPNREQKLSRLLNSPATAIKYYSKSSE